MVPSLPIEDCIGGDVGEKFVDSFCNVNGSNVSPEGCDNKTGDRGLLPRAHRSDFDGDTHNSLLVTGGQCSKATPRGAVAKFAAAGKPGAKKDLGLMAMSYGNVYVAKVAMGANDQHTLRAFLEAEAYDGPSLIIAYSHCIAHGINMTTGMQNQKAAVDSGYWQLYRYNPELEAEAKNPFKLESKGLKIPLKNYAYMETRYKMLTKSHPKEAEVLIKEAQEDVVKKWKDYERMAAYTPDGSNGNEEK